MKNKQVIMDLIGRVVIVDPELDTRPALRKGECCIIQDIRSEISRDLIYVGFEDGKIDRFIPGDLLILKPKREILQSIVGFSANINRDDYKALMKILHLETDKNPAMALKLAMSKDFYKKHCVVNCQQWVITREEQRLKKFRQNKKSI
jgi:hypothetical protein